MAKRVPLDKLAGELSAILSDYADDVGEGLAQAVDTTAKSAQKALRSSSPRRKGKYAKSWKVQVERGRLWSTATVYSTKPGLPHLLEFGHVSRNGTGRDYGTVAARPHIEKVEQQAIDDFQKNVRERLQS